jgi:hypothetical protein
MKFGDMCGRLLCIGRALSVMSTCEGDALHKSYVLRTGGCLGGAFTQREECFGVFLGTGWLFACAIVSALGTGVFGWCHHAIVESFLAYVC